MNQQTTDLVVAEYTADHTFLSRSRSALGDIRESIRCLPLAIKLAWLDIRLRYRGSLLGPFWLTLSTGVMVGALGYLYAGIFHTDVHDYFPFLALSLVLWNFASTMVSESCTAFIESEATIRSMRIPYTFFALRTVVRNVVVLAHNVIIIVAVYAVFQVWPGWHALLAIPGILMWGIDAMLLVLLLGPLCARFRDIPPIIGSIMQIAFFVTPVIWKPAQIGSSARFLPINPFYDLLEIVRAPLLGHLPEPNAWIGAAGFSVVLAMLTWGFFIRARSRIAFWL